MPKFFTAAMAKKNPVAIETTGFFRGTPERISPLGDKPRIRGAQQKNLPHGRFFVVRPSGFPLSGINLESAAHSKKTASRQVFCGTPERISPFGDKPRIRGAQQKNLPHGRFFRGTPERISPFGDKPRIRGAQQKNLPHGRFFRGTPERIRTAGLQSRSLSLYPAELRAHIQQELL